METTVLEIQGWIRYQILANSNVKYMGDMFNQLKQKLKCQKVVG